eukprot:scaffold4.g4636.t1
MAVAADALLTAAIQLRDSLQASATLTKQATEQCESVAAQMRALEQEAAALVVRTGSLQQARANIKKAQQRADQVLEHLDASRKYQPVVRAGPHADLGAFLKVVGQLEETVKFLLLLESNRSRTAADALPHAAALRDDAVSQCAAEFALLLRQHAARPPDPPAAPAPASRMRERGGSLKEGTAAAAAAGPVPSATDLVPEPVLEQLKALAEVLLKSNVRGCIATYVDVRQGVHRKALERHLEQLGREEVARLGWQQLEGRIPGWSAALRLYVRLVQAESKLSAAVFRPSDQAAVVAPGAASLVDVAGAVFCTKREPEKIFALLEMHAAVEGALPALHAAAAAAGGRLDRTSVAGALARFSPGPQGAPSPPAAQQLGPVQELAALRGKLAAEARTCFKGLQEAVALDAGGAAPADATVHPLCASTVPSLKRILGFETALPVLFGEDARGGPCGGSDTGLAEEARLLERMTGAVGRVLDALLSGLETRARAAYRSPAQAALAMANNALFLCKSIEGSKELRAVGEGWWEAHKHAAVYAAMQQLANMHALMVQAMADQYAKQYEELATGVHNAG